MLAKRLSQFDTENISSALKKQADSGRVDLSIGYPSEPTPEYIREAGKQAIDHGFTKYSPGNGYLDLRIAIADKLSRDNSIHVAPEAVSVTPGLTTAIVLCYGALLDPGDEVIVADPYFPPYASLAAVVGATAVLIDTYPDFQLTAARIEPHITSRTKAIVVNSPNNPTGAVYPESELRKIAALAESHNLIVISDEIYEPFAYTERHFSIGSIYPQTLTLNGFSKSYAMTGWRIGYIAGPQQIIDAINALSQYMVFSASSIGQQAALAALSQPPTEIREIYKRKHELALNVLSPLGPIAGAAGAFYLFLPTPENVDDLEFTSRVDAAGVTILPGRVFSSRSTHIRIAFVAPEADIRSALTSIVDVLPRPAQIHN